MSKNHVSDQHSPSVEKRNADEGPQSVMGVIRDIDERVRTGNLVGFQPIATGFDGLDTVLGSGFALGQLVLLSGAAGVGKTSLGLQMARNIAASNQAACLFVCYEHQTDYLAQRLVVDEEARGLVARGDI